MLSICHAVEAQLRARPHSGMPGHSTPYTPPRHKHAPALCRGLRLPIRQFFLLIIHEIPGVAVARQVTDGLVLDRTVLVI